MSTPAQALASRLNGSLSHGPASESGKGISSRNALKTGLTGHTVLQPSEDAALYEAHIHSFQKRYNPIGDEEFAWSSPSPVPNGGSSASPVSRQAFTLWAAWNSPPSSPTKTRLCAAN